ncbi:hypothetical protein LCGC14_2462480 [marine sediment metagenome]|uniref:Uncharacterized protein n=1 Tax=marine sediment metagenome TaxID=412755 RepID=A0A0F9DPZ9_9ZZZZ
MSWKYEVTGNDWVYEVTGNDWYYIVTELVGDDLEYGLRTKAGGFLLAKDGQILRAKQ